MFFPKTLITTLLIFTGIFLSAFSYIDWLKLNSLPSLKWVFLIFLNEIFLDNCFNFP